jgi:hypothetical protein
MVVVSFWLITLRWYMRIGLLALWFTFLWLLPFVELLNYLSHDFSAPLPPNFWGIANIEYMNNPDAVTTAAAMGAYGVLGILVGTLAFSPPGNILREQRQVTRSQSFPFTGFLLLFVSGILIAYISVPPQPIWSVRYTDSTSSFSNALPSAWLISSAVACLLVSNAIYTESRRPRILRTVLALIVVVAIVYFQFSRGSRDVIGLVPAVLLMFFYWNRRLPLQRTRATFPWLVLAALGPLFIVGQVLGVVRTDIAPNQAHTHNPSDVAGTNFGPFELGSTGRVLNQSWDRVSGTSIDSFVHGTWSAVLLTPLSAAAESQNDLKTNFSGSDYLDLVLSLPPQFFFDYLSLERPVSSSRGPAADLSLTGGGLHASVLAYRELGLLGVFVIGVLWAVILNKIEAAALRRKTPASLFLLGFTFTTITVSVWYGDKIAVTGSILLFIFLGIQTVLTPKRASRIADSLAIARMSAVSGRSERLWAGRFS